MKCAVALLLLLVAPVYCQTIPGASIERQREAVERQLRRAQVLSPSTGLQIRSVERQERAVRSRPQTARANRTAMSAPWSGARELAMQCNRVDPVTFAPMLELSARENALSPEILSAVIRRESDFQPCAISPAGAMGLMQLMPGTAESLGVVDPLDPFENVRAGSRYLREMLDRYNGNLPLALGAYNAGPGRVDAVRGLPEIRETRDYVSEILRSLGGSGSIWESRVEP